MTGAALWGGVGPHPWPRAGGMNASSLFKPLLCPQLFGDVCYTCSHVIEGDGPEPAGSEPQKASLGEDHAIHAFGLGSSPDSATYKA